MQVPFFDYASVYLRFREQFLGALDSVGSRGAFINQAEVVELEDKLAEYCGAADCVAVSNATDALLMAFVAADLPPGAEVIMSSHTMVATAEAVRHAGLTPVPVEVGNDHMIDPSAIRTAISARTAAICPTHLNGRTCDMVQIGALAEEFGLTVVEDSAQALGSRYQGKSAGTWGLAGCLSFYPAKILGPPGDGGALLVKDRVLGERLRAMRDHGRAPSGEIMGWGFNARLDNLAAAFLLIQFEVFDETVAYRRAIASRYWENLRGCSRISLPEEPGTGEHFDTFQNFEILCDDRDELRDALMTAGVGTLKPWGGYALHHLRGLGFQQKLPKTDEFFERVLLLPIYPGLSFESVDFVCDALLSFYDE